MAANSIRVSPVAMARPSLAPAPASSAKEPKQFDISNLMSPPDLAMDSFNHANKHFNMVNSLANAANGGQSAAKHPLPMSPPISPYSKPATTTEAPATPHGLVKDPLLYPSDDRGSSSPPQPPLFASAELEDHRHIIDIHLRSQSPSTFGSVSPPRREDYELVLSRYPHAPSSFPPWQEPSSSLVVYVRGSCKHDIELSPFPFPCTRATADQLRGEVRHRTR
jgi:hypothetical protein